MDRQLCDSLKRFGRIVDDVKWDGDRLIVIIKIPSFLEKTAREMVECIKGDGNGEKKKWW